jgi:hypothetical protein
MIRSAVESSWSEWKVSSSSVVDAVGVGDAQDLGDMGYLADDNAKEDVVETESDLLLSSSGSVRRELGPSPRTIDMHADSRR